MLINDYKDGYSKTLCLRIEMTNSYFIEKSFTVT